MANTRGERFYVDLEGDDASGDSTQISEALSSFGLVGDVLERAPSQPAPPSAPKSRVSVTGFPEHRKRTRPSTFKQRSGHVAEDASVDSTASKAANSIQNTEDDVQVPQSFEEADRIRIDQENRQKLASMSSEEIGKERDELFSGLSPALIERLLKRSNINGEALQQTRNADPENKISQPSKERKHVSFAESPRMERRPSGRVDHSISHPEHEPRASNDITKEDDSATPPKDSIHFPKPPETADLDPSDPSFFDELHEKYFPDLAHDPSKLSWMKDAPTDDKDSPYHPSHASLPASALRFNFGGALLPPNLSRQIPTSAGLHHHGDAPEAAGYTIPELAHLAHSSYAPQRCVAYQTLGRILYRLGSGSFGQETDANEEIANLPGGMWDCIEETKVLDVMTAEAKREKGHLSARTYAQEAVWNWQRGGGRKRKAQ